MKSVECFKIRIYSTIGSVLDIKNWTPLLDIKSCSNKRYTSTNPFHIEADPFLFVKNEKLYLFYESKPLFGKGIINMVYTKDLKTWSEPVSVLQESYHLSYPWVFVHEDNVYMIPETCATKSIRLYRAENEELTKFSYVKTLITENKEAEFDCSFSDSSFVKRDGIFFMFTNVLRNEVNEVKLYVSDSLEGDYKEHPLSPVCVGMKYGRNGGHLFEYEGKLIRVAQDCSDRYGDDVHLLEIQALSPSKYHETVFINNLLANKTLFHKEGGHQFNFVRFRDEIIIATDAKEYHKYLTQRIMRKIKRYGI